MSTYRKITKSEVGNIIIEMIQCDFCGIETQNGHTINWIHTQAVDTEAQRMGDISIEGDFCSRPCVSSYFTWKKGEPLPKGTSAALERQIASTPRYTVTNERGQVIYSGNDDVQAMRALEASR